MDVLVNNAGIVGPAGVPAHELDEQAWTVMLDIDLTGPLAVRQSCPART